MAIRVRRAVGAIAGLIVLTPVALWLWPSRIDPVAWEPPDPPEMEGPFEPNDDLRKAELLAQGQLNGAEDVAVDARGRVYAGTHDGDIVRIGPDGSVEKWANTGGHPLGLDWDPEGNLIVADAHAGLLSVSPDAKVTVLSTEAGGKPYKFTDDVDVARDGTIYFSDASWKFSQPDYMFDLMEGRPHGRLMRHDPRTGQTAVLLDDLYFANGVALSPEEDYVLVNETYRYRITRYWLAGAKAGTSETFADNLPGYPDGISSNGKGTYWVAMFTVRNPAAHMLAPRPALRDIVTKLPRALWPKAKPYGFVLGFDEAGEPVHNLQDPSGTYLWQISAAEEHDGYLFLGTLDGDRIGVYPLDP